MAHVSALFAVWLPTPLAAIGLAGAVAAVPVIIHLLSRKRYVVVTWAAMRFLLSAQKQNLRRLKIEQWVLLAVRILVGLLLVAAIAAATPWAESLWRTLLPDARPGQLSHGRTHRILVIDGSFSMAARHPDGTSRFDTARAQAKAILERSNPGDGFSVVFLTNPAQTVVPGPADDAGRVAREIDQLTLPHGGSDVAGGLHAVAEMVGAPLGKYSLRQVYFLTDLKRSGWPLPGIEPSAGPPGGPATAPPSGLAESWRQVNANASVAFVDVAREDVDNLAVTALTLADPLPQVGVTTSVSAVVRNHGRLDRRQVKVEFRVGSAPEGTVHFETAEQKLIDIPAGGSVTVNFALERQNRFRRAGDHLLQVRLDPDPLPLDDQRTLSVKVRDTIPVIVVNGKPAADPLERAGTWLSRALYPFPLSQKVTGYPARPRTLNLAEFADVGLGDLTGADVVFLADVPRVSGSEAARLETHLRRGGSVVIGLGPNAAQNLDHYNRVLFAEGTGLLPGRLLGTRRADGDHFFSLVADEDALQRAPLAAFRGEDERAGLTLPRFRQYVRLEAPTGGPARRLLSFLPSSLETPPDGEPGPSRPGLRPGLDPAIVEWPRHRGRVIVYTSTFNTDWTNWPLSPTFAPFVQELLRFTASGGERHTAVPGEPLEEYLPASFVGLTARWHRQSGEEPESLFASAPVIAQDEAGLARLENAERSGIYRIDTGHGRASALFAVNVPVTSSGGGSESDLRRLTPADIQASAPEAAIQVVTGAGEIRYRARPGAPAEVADEPGRLHGPAVARWVLLALLVMMLFEVLLAWRYGSSRAAGGATDPAPPARRRFVALIWVIPLAGCAAVLAVVLHAAVTGEFLGFLGGSVRESIERSLGVPASAPGEGVRWRLEWTAFLTGDQHTDRWLSGGPLVMAVALVMWVYRRERPTGTSRPAGSWSSALSPAAVLRIGLVLLTLLVLLPQLRLAFEREGWPDVAVILDDSRSMATVDNGSDRAARERVGGLKATWAQLAAPRIDAIRREIDDRRVRLDSAPPGDVEQLREELSRLEARLADMQSPHRLNLVKALLASPRRDWLHTLLADRRMRVHIYRVSEQASLLAELNDPARCEAVLGQVIDTLPTGNASQLGHGLTHVLQTFRGGSLNAVIMFTDGITTKGEDLPAASRLAARMGVPLYLVGAGDAIEPPDVILSDLQVADSVNVNDRLVFEVRVRRQGRGMPDTIPVVLYEAKDGKKVELTRQEVRLDPDGKPVRARLTHTPTDPGEKTYVVEVPPPAGDTEPANNRQERVVFVAENKRTRVLLIDNFPRYEFRFLKTLFERGTDVVRGNKTVELNVLLLSAHEQFAREDRSALGHFPTGEELNTYDAVILGDVDPRQLPRGEASLQALADFVQHRGGGLLFLAGEHWMPNAYRDTALAPILPVTWDGIPAPAEPPAGDRASILAGYRPRLTPVGQSHPLFRFAADEAENADVWNHLPKLLWHAGGYRRKLSAEVLAVHPDLPAEHAEGSTAGRDEKHPLVLQQFVGAGRVLFFGFDETWRWRLRENEVRFNQFWLQAIRSLARTRVGRIEVRLDRQTAYRQDEPIGVTVRFPDDGPPPPADVPVRVEVERRLLRLPGAPEPPPGEVEHQTLTLAPREGTRATYETVLTRTPEGEYRFTLKEPATAGTRPRAEARVLPPPGELDRLQLNETDLQRAARESHGAYYPLDRAEALLDELPAGPRVALDQPCPPLSLWDSPWMFALAFSLLVAEWVLRKRARLL